MESKKRTIIKAVSYRSLVTAILAMLSWIFTANIDQTALITILYAILATVMKEFGIESAGKRKEYPPRFTVAIISHCYQN